MTMFGPEACNEPATRASAIRSRKLAVLLSTTALLAIGFEAAHAQQAPVAQQGSASAEETVGLAEVVVTAQRRTQNLQEIPYNISVVSSAPIANAGASTIDDLTRLVTGLTSVDQGPAARGGNSNLTLRGLRADSPTTDNIPHLTASTVSTYFGETPIFFPMVLRDVDRVEVLRGPQGTLYGSGAEGGTIRFIPRAPQFDGLSGSLNASSSHSKHSGSLNGDIHGVINIPLSENLAIRVGAGYERLAGFIDAVNLWQLGANGVPVPSIPGNLSSGPVIAPRKKDVNRSNQSFERVAIRWEPGIFDFELNYQHQRTTQASGPDVTPNWPGGCQDLTATNQGAPVSCANPRPSTFLTNAGGPYTVASYLLQPYEDTVDLGSFVANVDFGLATLTSASSYYEDQGSTFSDAIGPYQNIAGGDGGNFINFPPYNNYPRLAPSAPTLNRVRSFVQEVRLTSKTSGRLDYVVGAFYQDQKLDSSFYQVIPGITDYLNSIGRPHPSPLGDVSNILVRNGRFRDKALFGELTFHLTDAWQVTGGARVFRQTFSNEFLGSFPLTGTPAFSGDNKRTFKDHLLKVNTSYDFSSNTKVYVTYSEGFRHGGANAIPTGGLFASLPQYTAFDPDFVKNYEAGIKGTLRDNRLRYSAAIYRIDLQNFQFSGATISQNFGTFNGNDARSEGAEFELQAAITRDLNVTFGYAYTKARTTEAVALDDYPPFALAGGGPGRIVPLFRIPSGTRLPGVPSHTANFSIDYTTELGSQLDMLVHLDGAYRSSAAGTIDVDSVNYWKVPASFVGNARVVFTLDQKIDISVFATNVTNAKNYQAANGEQAIPAPYSFRVVSRPRTIGLGIEYRF